MNNKFAYPADFGNAATLIAFFTLLSNLKITKGWKVELLPGFWDCDIPTLSVTILGLRDD